AVEDATDRREGATTLVIGSATSFVSLREMTRYAACPGEPRSRDARSRPRHQGHLWGHCVGDTGRHAAELEGSVGLLDASRAVFEPVARVAIEDALNVA